MFILMISRGIPTASEPQWGCFEKDQAEALAALGHKVVVASVDSRFRLTYRHLGITHQIINGIDYYNSFLIPGALTAFLGKAFSLQIKTAQFNRIFSRIMQKHGRPDVIFGQFFFNTVLGVKVHRKYNIPLVGIEHAGRFNDNTLDPKTRYEAGITYKNTDAVIAVSSNLQKALKRHFGIEADVVHNTFGPEFRYAPYYNDDGICHLISVGSLLHGKGFDLLVKALADINGQMPKWDLQIIGEGDFRPQLEQLITEHRLQDKISLPGRRNKQEIAAVLQSSDCFILPSRGENFSVAVLEALACGCPVIASDCGDIKACITDLNGMIFPVEDTVALEQCLLHFFEHRQDYDREAIAADCHARFSSEVIAKQLTEIFNQVLSTGK